MQCWGHDCRHKVCYSGYLRIQQAFRKDCQIPEQAQKFYILTSIVTRHEFRDTGLGRHGSDDPCDMISIRKMVMLSIWLCIPLSFQI